MPRARLSEPAEAQDGAVTDTGERIFLAAERLFAERGFDGVSVRDIVQEAQVNLAAVSYHFGSKSELLLAVFRIRTKEMNRERRAVLREAEAQHGGAPPLEAILRALLGPPILWRDPASGKDTASRFISRAISEATPELRKILETDVSHLRGFLPPLARALPDCRARRRCAGRCISPLACRISAPTRKFKRLEALSDGRCDTADVRAVLERAVRFALGGIEALQADENRASLATRGLTAPGQGENDPTARNKRSNRYGGQSRWISNIPRRSQELRARVREFMDRYVIPNNTRWRQEVAEGLNPPPVVDELKAIAKAEGLWNMFLPGLKPDEPGTRLTNLEYAPLAEIMGQLQWASEVFNCSAPDTGNMELLHMFATPDQRERWLKPLLERRNPLLLRDDRAGFLVVGRDQHLAPASSAKATNGSSTAASGSSPAR